ncbi:MAG: LysE/ArgO family amino acid transporter [Paracoccaceae bacterium]|nr:amino acid transporter [Marinovum sp.]MBQ67210.1 amino acid transporter [Marinovum sp.]MDG2296375.1 LysE/ArgO family amino acid transporter [Paracoccaceae bacterium]|tara:strand:- start:693 stop:1289 length:597 start_codon:yes stop_codon:yes gene_type:complete
MQALFSGFGLGLSLILAIGAQNAFVLRAGLLKRYVFIVCLTCSLSDALLIYIGVNGLGRFVQSMPVIIDVMRYGGAIFLVLYGAKSLYSAWRGGTGLTAAGEFSTLRAAALTCLALTWLNPHVYLDTVILLGSIAVQSPQPGVFGIGAILASFVFFFTLGYGAQLLAPFFARPRAWQVLDIGIAAVMFSIAFGLILSQ